MITEEIINNTATTDYSITSNLIEKNLKDSPKAWTVICCAALFFLYTFINMTCFNGINSQLISAFNVSAVDISHLSAMYFYANILFLIPAGILLDKFSIRRLMLIIMPISIASTFIFAHTHNYYFACIVRFIMGVASTFCLLSCAKLTAQWMSPKFAGRAMSIAVTIAMFGGVIAQQLPLLMPVIMHKNANWSDLLTLISILGVCFYILIFLFVQDYPVTKSNSNSNLNHNNKTNSWSAALLNKQNYLLGFLTNFLSTPIMILGSLWGVRYLTETKLLDNHQATLCCSLLFIGMIIGSPFFGWISDYIKNRKKPLYFGIVGSLAIISIIITDRSQAAILMPILFFALGFLTSAQVLTYTMIIELNPPENCAFSESIASTIIMSSGAIFQPLFGYLLSHNAILTNVSSNIIVNNHNYFQAMLIFPIVFVISIGLLLLSKESADLH